MGGWRKVGGRVMEELAVGGRVMEEEEENMLERERGTDNGCSW
jgi:hypothetical protein